MSRLEPSPVSDSQCGGPNSRAPGG